MDSETPSHNLRMVALSLTNSYTDTQFNRASKVNTSEHN